MASLLARVMAAHIPMASELPCDLAIVPLSPKKTPPFTLLGSILFLGGWLSPIDIYPFNVLPGVFWMIFKLHLYLFPPVEHDPTRLYF